MTVEELINALKHYNKDDKVLFSHGMYRYKVSEISEKLLHEDFETPEETRSPNSALKKYIVIGE